jgi:GGDEF domain-containing protein
MHLACFRFDRAKREKKPMKIFDQIDAGNLDRREWQLWVLALAVILVLAAGMALLMYPTIFSAPVIVTGPTQRKAFFGFCALAILLLGYLVDRQIMIRHLRKQLEEDQRAMIKIRHEASIDLLQTLPGFEHFQDRLAMEYRRASTMSHPLSLLIVALKSARSLTDTREVPTAFGDAAKALLRRLRGEDSMYLFSPGVFCLVLPGVSAQNAYRITSRLTEGLQDASGASDRFTFELRVFNYPEHAKTAREIEEAVRPFVPKSPPLPSLEEAPATPTGSE